MRSGPRARGASGPILLLFQPSSEVGPRANHSRSRFLRDSEATGIGPSLFPHKRTHLQSALVLARFLGGFYEGKKHQQASLSPSAVDITAT